VPKTKRKVGPLYRRYEGILAEPREGIDLPPLDQFSDREVPPWFSAIAPVEAWPTVVRCLEAAHQDSRRDVALRLEALRKFYAIEVAYPGWIRDLTLTLAFRHERKKFAGSDKVSYAALFVEHGLDPERADDEFLLLLALAGKHVPGFRFRSPDINRGRLDDDDLTVLVLGFSAAIDNLRQTGGEVSANAVALKLSSRSFLATLEPADFGKDLKRVLQKLANTERGRERTASIKTLRNYFRAWSTAAGAFLQGRPSRLQLQLLRVQRRL